MFCRLSMLFVVLMCLPDAVLGVDENAASNKEEAAAPSTLAQVTPEPGQAVTLRVLAASVVLNAVASHVEAGEAHDVPHGTIAEGLARDLNQPPADQRPATWSDRARELLDAKARDATIELFFQAQLATLAGQPTSMHIGRQLPRVTGTNMSPRGAMNSVTYQNHGTMMELIPVIEPNGSVVVGVQFEVSTPGAEEAGAPLAAGGDGQPIRAPTTETAMFKTTVRTRPGETIIVGDQCHHRDGKLVEFFLLLETELATEK